MDMKQQEVAYNLQKENIMVFRNFLSKEIVCALGFIGVVLALGGCGDSNKKSGLSALRVGTPLKKILGDVYLDSLTSGDVDGDGIDEVIVEYEMSAVGSDPNSIFILSSADFSVLKKIDNVPDLYYDSVVACDVDGDGRDEIITLNYESDPEPPYIGIGHRIEVHRFDSDAKTIKYTFDPKFRHGGAMNCGDMNNDGLEDLVMYMGTAEEYDAGNDHIMVLDSATNSVTLDFVTTSHRVYEQGLALGDVNGDGHLDIASAEGAEGVNAKNNYEGSVDYWVRVYDGRDGRILPNHEHYYGKNEFKFLSVTVGELGSDNAAEVIVGVSVDGVGRDNRPGFDGRVNVHSGATGQVVFSRAGRVKGASYGRVIRVMRKGRQNFLAVAASGELNSEPRILGYVEVIDVETGDVLSLIEPATPEEDFAWGLVTVNRGGDLGDDLVVRSAPLKDEFMMSFPFDPVFE